MPQNKRKKISKASARVRKSSLKCWKKVKDARHPTRKVEGVWFNKKKTKGVSIESSDFSSDWMVYHGNPKNANSRQFKTIPQALKFAKSYMKKHNKC